MEIANLKKRIKHPKGEYYVNLLLTDNNKICKREDLDWERSQFDSAIYLFVKKSSNKTDMGWGISFTGTLHYIGFTKTFLPNDILNSRVCTHKSDLLSGLTNDKYKCYVIYGLSVEEAHCLEAYWIKTSDRQLSKPGAKILKRGCLINKRRERKWEECIDKYLAIENQWK